MANRQYLAQVLCLADNKFKLAACNYWLLFTEDWLQSHMVRRENCLLYNNHQTSRQAYTWKLTNAREPMEQNWWPGWEWYDVKIFFVLWFEGSFNSKVYLEQVLMSTVWHAVKALASKSQNIYNIIRHRDSVWQRVNRGMMCRVLEDRGESELKGCKCEMKHVCAKYIY